MIFAPAFNPIDVLLTCSEAACLHHVTMVMVTLVTVAQVAGATVGHQ